MSRVLVTGSNGLVGRRVVKALLDEGYSVLGIDSAGSTLLHKNYVHIKIDLTNVLGVEEIFNSHDISHVIHLAAIAHKAGQGDLSWSRYYRINTLCAKTVFECAAARKIPVFFSSTVDVYGIAKGTVTAETRPQPIGYYARSKQLAEEALISICKDTPYTIARFAPVYSESAMRDIRKRYFLKYPKWCYLVGGGLSYEFLSVHNIARAVTEWVKGPQDQRTILLSDKKRIFTAELIKAEEKRGLKIKTLRLPLWPFKLLNIGARLVFGGQSHLGLMVSKIAFPLRITREKELGYGL
ncbi:MAG TPA: NAD(P)-dependent oxidoreductase [Clostridiales bacterium]|jgi:nucleoside-diphosphate-sugar epimerase|nr:NAD(P)-dependent oxidoreductase [Clostridiales bacterium]